MSFPGSEAESRCSTKEKELLRARAEARLKQAQVELRRMVQHERVIAQMANAERRKQLTSTAEEHIARWDSQGLCWSGYVDAWRDMLAMPVDQMAKIILAQDGRGPALRQNSPFLSIKLDA